jgi:hypothetical protein
MIWLGLRRKKEKKKVRERKGERRGRRIKKKDNKIQIEIPKEKSTLHLITKTYIS